MGKLETSCRFACDACDKEVLTGDPVKPFGWTDVQIAHSKGISRREWDFMVCEDCLPQTHYQAYADGTKKTFKALWKKLFTTREKVLGE